MDDQYHGRCYLKEKRLWEKAAAKQGRSLNNWIRQTLNDASSKLAESTDEKKIAKT